MCLEHSMQSCKWASMYVTTKKKKKKKKKKKEERNNNQGMGNGGRKQYGQ